MVMLPFVMFMFEFNSSLFALTNYQVYAAIFMAFVFIAAGASGHRGIALIAFAIGAFLTLPNVITFAFSVLLGRSSVLDSNYFYYAAHFISIAAALIYFRASGVSPKDLFLTKSAGRESWLWAAGFAAAAVLTMMVYFKASGLEPAIAIGDRLFKQVVLAAIFAVSNGVMEELWFRGLIFGALVRAFPPRFSVIYQAVLFGIIHFNGVPSGGVGVALGFIFGAALGFLTLKAKSILPAFGVHIAVDLAIGLYMT